MKTRPEDLRFENKETIIDSNFLFDFSKLVGSRDATFGETRIEILEKTAR